MKKSYIVALLMLSIVISYGVGRYTTPNKVITKTEVKIQKVVEHKVKTRTVIREMPNGVKITEIVSQSEKKSNISQVTKTKKIVKNTPPQWSVAFGRGLSEYELHADRRILGGLFLGVSARSDMQFNDVKPGIYLRYEF